MDFLIYKIANQIHSKFGLDLRSVQQVLQLAALEIGNTGGPAIAYHVVNSLTNVAGQDPTTLEAIFKVAKAQAAGNTLIVNQYITEFAQQVDNGADAAKTLKEIVSRSNTQAARGPGP